MQLTTKASELKDRVKVLSSFLSQKGQPECLLTASKTEGLLLEGFNDGSYLKCRIPAEVYEEGQVVIKSTYLTSLKLGGQVTLKLTGSLLDFSAGKFHGQIETSQDLERFVNSRPTKKIETPFNMTGEAFTTCLKRATLLPTLANQPYGICCKLYGDENDPTLPATLEMSSIESGMRAVLVKQVLPQVLPQEEGKSNVFLDVIFPPLVSITGKIKGPIQIGTDGQIFRLFSGDIDLYQPLLSLDVINVDQWIAALPQEDAKSISVDIVKLKQGIAEATSVAVSVGSGHQSVNLDCKASKDTLSIDVHAANGHASSEVALLDRTSGDETEFILVAKYLSECLSLLDKGEIEVKVWSKPAAVLVSSGATQEKVNAEQDPEKHLQLQKQMLTQYIVPQVDKNS